MFTLWRGLRFSFHWFLGLAISLSIVIGVGALPQFSGRAIAAVLSHSEPLIEISVHLGNSTEELKFVPDHLEFIAGRRYKLVLDNPSSQKHYFTAKDFADAIWTQKVEAGNVEVKGAIHELELKPGAIAEWVFVPLKSGTYELHCSIAGHSEAGMRGVLTVAEQQPV
ncbi:cupredoxin domain-containing protein [Leptolyngbya sp. FACHB-671]|uniref:cupredoxin domain-containing protein n=1 Tax=Leptolyngbya sp. FACHB-671 TaxID=2692812 RepID=UPI001681D38A|nr:cupredoxin domain-containing protein [Leptolyngbya sp. FACHB-671]MBD2070448.1 cupredoxin domain-containing protein [Leptolyngbya sp. FACHB-671]